MSHTVKQKDTQTEKQREKQRVKEKVSSVCWLALRCVVVGCGYLGYSVIVLGLSFSFDQIQPIAYHISIRYYWLISQHPYTPLEIRYNFFRLIFNP